MLNIFSEQSFSLSQSFVAEFLKNKFLYVHFSSTELGDY